MVGFCETRAECPELEDSGTKGGSEKSVSVSSQGRCEQRSSQVVSIFSARSASQFLTLHGADAALRGANSAPSITPPRYVATRAKSHRPPVAVQASAHLPRCSRVAHSQPLPARTTTTTASCPTARGQLVRADPFGPQIIPRSRDTRLGSLVDTMSAKKTRSTIGVKCKPAEQKGSENVLRSQANFRRVQWMWRLGSQSSICPTVHNAQDTRDSEPVCTVSAD